MSKKKLTVYANVDASVKRGIDKLAAIHKRKVNAEVEIALQEYLERHQDELAEAEEQE